jgi:hypothetical protein
MLGKFFTAALRKPPREVEDFDQDVEAAQKAVDAFSFAPMTPLHPPVAQNDHPLHGFCKEIEEDLRAAGYLR